MNGISLVENSGRLPVRISMKMKKRRRRKEITVPVGLDGVLDENRAKDPFVIALARAYCWLELLRFRQIPLDSEMAHQLGVCSSYMRRLLRLTLLAPDIVEAIIDGNEPDGFSQNMLVGAMPTE